MEEKENREVLREKVKKELLTEHEKKGKFPLWGKILVGCFCSLFLIIPLFAALILVNINSARDKAQWANAQSTASSITSAVMLYNDDCEKFPSKLKWGESFNGEANCLPENLKYIEKLPAEKGTFSTSLSIEYSYMASSNNFKLSVKNTKTGEEYVCTKDGCDN